VGPSALYRHFAGKDQLLAEVIADIADRFATQVDDLPAAVAFTLDHRPIGVLWEREARHLPTEIEATVRAKIRHARDRFIDAVHTARPDVRDPEPLAAAVLAVLLSPSFHSLELPRPAYDTLLTDLATRALTADIPHTTAATTPAAEGLRRASKRERLLGEAVRLFAERTYTRVSMEDLAVAVGINASSVYNYFPTKATMLVTALERANGYLQVTLDDTLAASHDAVSALHGLVACYTGFALTHPHLLDVLITETHNLPRDEMAPLLAAQHAYVDEWVHLLRQIHPDLDAAPARVTIHAGLTLVNDLARTPGIRTRPHADGLITALCRQVLAI
jgi:AcrR family transcriptional regulator